MGDLNKNMSIWNAVCKTNTVYLKDGQKDGMSSINTQYYFMRATEVFGPIGIGWGFDILDSYITEGQTMKGDLDHKTAPFLDYKVSQMTVKINFWYMLEGKKGQFTQYGHTPLVMKTKYGPMMDDDPEKKSLSDAIKKALTLLGFCADVFLGKFDDISYAREIKDEEFAEAQKEKLKKNQDIYDQINKIIKDASLNYQACTTVSAINGMCKSDVMDIDSLCRKININPESYLSALKTIVQQRREDLSNVKN